MNRLRAWLVRVLALVWSRYDDHSLEEELRHHRELLTDHLVGRGMSAEAARREASGQLGSLAVSRDAYRDQRTFGWLERLWTDVRHAVRGLLRAPSFSLVTIVTLALGIGATTVVFSVVYGVLLRPLPYPHPERIVRVFQRTATDTGAVPVNLETRQFRSLRAESRAFAHVAGYGRTPMTLATDSGLTRLNGARATARFFEVFGVAPILGRTFDRDHEQSGSDAVVILSAKVWARNFGADPAILERPILLDDRAYRVLGIMPESFVFPEAPGPTEFWIPYVLPRMDAGTVAAVARLNDSSSLPQAEAEVGGLLGSEGPSSRTSVVVPIQFEMTRPVRQVLLLFQIGAGLLMAIACMNVANLLLARVASRRRELEICIALGASVAQVACRLLVETSVLVALGALSGSALIWPAFHFLRTLRPGIIPRLDDVRVDAPVWLFTLGVVIATAATLTAFVMWRVFRHGADRCLPSVSPSSFSVRTGHARPSQFLVVAEVAGAVVLFTIGALLLSSFVSLTRVNPGFQTDRVMTFRMLVPRQAYPDVIAHRLLHARMIAALEAVPGVERAAIASAHPFETAAMSGSRSFFARFVFVTPGYFDVLGVSLLKGQSLESAANGVVVNERLGREMWPDADPIGRVVDWPTSPVVVAVARDTKAWRVTEDAEPILYSSYSELARIDQILRPTGIVRTSLDPASILPEIQQAFRSIAPGVTVYDAAVLRESVADSYAESTLYGATAGGLGIISLALAAIGLYGVLAYSVSRRTRELGVRIALGATPERILGGVLKEGLIVTMIGLAIGLAGALGATRLVAGLLYDVTPGDPMTFLAVTAIFLVVATLACYIPARRATRVDPVIALSAE